MEKMDIKISQLAEARNALEERLTTFLAAELADFRDATGVSVTGLSAQFMDATSLPDLRRRLKIIAVRVSVDLD